MNLRVTSDATPTFSTNRGVHCISVYTAGPPSGHESELYSVPNTESDILQCIYNGIHNEIHSEIRKEIHSEIRNEIHSEIHIEIWNERLAGNDNHLFHYFKRYSLLYIGGSKGTASMDPMKESMGSAQG